MKNIIITLTILCAMLEMLSLLLLAVEHVVIKNKLKRTVERENLIKLFAEISIKYCECHKKGLFTDIPSVQAYLEQANFVITDCPYDIDKLEVGHAKSYRFRKKYEPLMNVELIKNIPKELNIAPSEVKDLFKSFLLLLERFYKIKYPVRSFYNLKKNQVLLKLLRFIATVLDSVIKEPSKEKEDVIKEFTYSQESKNGVILKCA